jgi:hypothetical protein
VQLATLPIKKTSRLKPTRRFRHFRNEFRHRLVNASPHSNGRIPHEPGFRRREVPVELPVETCTTTLPETPSDKLSDGGLKVQSAFAGSASHAKANVPDVPFSGVSTRVKLALWPAVTVWLPAPEITAVKSNPIP